MRRRPRCLIVFSVLFAVACGGAATPELQLIEDAAEAMGGLRSVSQTTALTVEGEGRTFRLGQNTRPRADLPYYQVENYLLQVDYANQRWRLSQDRTTTFLTGGPLYGARQTYGLDGDVAYDDAARASDKVAADRWAEMYRNPLGIVLLGLDETSTVSNLREEGAERVVDVVAANGTQFTLHVSAETGLPSKVVSSSYHPNLGDVAIETLFDGYQEMGGLGGFQARLTLPRNYTTNLDRFTISRYSTTADTNADVGDLSAPADVRAASAPMATVTVDVDEVTDGVWRLAGQSHHSALLEFEDFLVLIEAPQSEARTLAVIESARELRPDKPLRYVINTHHHFDHSAGIRAAVSEGLTVVTHRTNQSFYEDMVARRHSIVQDALTRNAQPLTLEAVSSEEPFEITDGSRTLQIATVVDDPHAEGMLMAYLPRERILFEVDAFSPSAAASPFAETLLRNIEDRELRVETIVPLHGEIATLEDLETAVEQEAQAL
ncbi:MAG TPA: MBL fold metallo-hydrolase [Acidobacteria bacterium]|nr:MBL fold metallo-hydrolase [Acidobacteriota bacterium]